MSETVTVYYGAERRWDMIAVSRIAQLAGQEPTRLNGLEADFVFDTEGEAYAVLTAVRALGIPARWRELGDRFPVEAVRASRDRVLEAFDAATIATRQLQLPKKWTL